MTHCLETRIHLGNIVTRIQLQVHSLLVGFSGIFFLGKPNHTFYNGIQIVFVLQSHLHVGYKAIYYGETIMQLIECMAFEICQI